jgi:hypothetical protein
MYWKSHIEVIGFVSASYYGKILNDIARQDFFLSLIFLISGKCTVPDSSHYCVSSSVTVSESGLLGQKRLE